MPLLIAVLLSVTGFEYMTVDPVAHRVGMGSALVGDGYSAFYNPAGLAYTVGLHYSASYLNYIAGTHFGFLGYERGKTGVAVRYFNGGTMKKTDEFGNEFGTFGVHFIDIGVARGFQYKDVGFGLGVKGVYENIDTLYCLGLGIDVGALYVFEEPEIQVGLTVKNIGIGVKAFIDEKEALPYEFILGGVKRFPNGWFGVDLVKPALMGIGLKVGGAYAVISNFEVKASYTSLLSSLQTGSSGLDFLAGLTAGCAVHTNRVTINYTYSPYFDLGGGHRVSVHLGG
jgi:hypothetical protein